MSPSDPAPAARQVPCPSCRRPALFGPGNPWRPFCSERCRNVDLGAWASERFRIPDKSASDAQDDSLSDGRPPQEQ